MLKEYKEKMNIVVLMDSFYPNFTMNGIIANNVVEELKKNHSVSVITFRDKFDQKRECVHKDVSVIRINNFNMCIHNYINKKIFSADKSRVKKKIWNLILSFKRAFFLAYRTFIMFTVDKKIISRIKKALKEMDSTKKIDLIIPVSAPYELIAAAIEYKEKHKDIKVVPIQLDYFSGQNDKFNFSYFKNLRRKLRMKIEKNVISNSEHYFSVPFLVDFFQNEFSELQDKISICHYPLIKKQVNVQKLFNQDNEGLINFVYTGSLSKRERNPKPFLEAMLLLTTDLNYYINFFHMGDCNDLIDDYVNISNSKVKNWGKVESAIAYSAMNSADILICIGSTNGNPIAGKTFDYISTGKPIIYFNHGEMDNNLVYFEKYPLSLCLDLSIESIENCSRKIFMFVNNIQGKEISFESVKEIFQESTPEYLENQILKWI